MSDALFKQLLKLPGRWQSIAVQQSLFHRGDPVKRLFVMDAGEVELLRSSAQGTLITMQRHRDCSVIAEASVFSDHYHCDAVSVTESRVYAITRRTVLRALRGSAAFSYLWNTSLASEVQALRMRNEILRLRTVRDKLDAWLVWTEQPLPPKGSWTGVASEIGVSAEALYREIASRRG